MVCVVERSPARGYLVTCMEAQVFYNRSTRMVEFGKYTKTFSVRYALQKRDAGLIAKHSIPIEHATSMLGIGHAPTEVVEQAHGMTDAK